MLLHKLTNSPFGSETLASCITFAVEQDAILLLQDAVYVLQHKLAYAQLSELPNAVYILQDDVEARGLKMQSETFTAIDYTQMVALSLKYKHVISW